MNKINWDSANFIGNVFKFKFAIVNEFQNLLFITHLANDKLYNEYDYVN